MTSKRPGMIVALVAIWSLAGLIGFAPSGIFPFVVTMDDAHAGRMDNYEQSDSETSGEGSANSATGDPDQYVNTSGDPDQYVGDPEVDEPAQSDLDPSKDPKRVENDAADAVIRFVILYLDFLF